MHQLRVGTKNYGFEILEAVAQPDLVAAIEMIEADLGKRLPDGFVSEVSLAAPNSTMSPPFSFAEYMQHALYAPGLGYYAAGAIKFGADGDFVFISCRDRSANAARGASYESNLILQVF